MLRYIDSTPIFTREAPSLTYSEHLTSQTLQATFFFEPKDFACRPPPPADRGSGQIFPSRPMSPLRCTAASEIFSKSSVGYPMENFFIGDFFFVRLKNTPAHKTHLCQGQLFHRGRKLFADPAAGGDCFLAPMFSLRYIAAFDFFLSPNAYLPWRTFSSGNSFSGRSRIH